MCWMCEKYGEGGLWYLNPKVYARQMYKLREPGKGPTTVYGQTGVRETAYGDETRVREEAPISREEVIRIRNEEPEKYDEALKRHNDNVHRGATAQAVPLQDAFKMVEIGPPLASMHCLCRKRIRGIEETNENEYSCLGTGVGMFKWERWPERYRGGVHFMPPDEAKEWLEKWDKRGLMHILMTVGVGYIEGICNCEYPDCDGIRHRLDYGILSMLKGHYVAQVDYDRCNGCGVCVQRCQFGAARFEVRIDKVNIDQIKCFGCGLCETGCPRNAITLVDRLSLPGLKEDW